MQTVIENPNWWKKSTALERRLTLVIILAFAAVLGLLIGLFSVIFSKQTSEYRCTKCSS